MPLYINENDNMHCVFPQKYLRKSEFLKEFDQTLKFSAHRWPGFNWVLTEALKWLWTERNLLDYNVMGADEQRLFTRSVKRIPVINSELKDEGDIVDHEVVFEILSDFTWVYTSQWQNKNGVGRDLASELPRLVIDARQLYKMLERLIDEMQTNIQAANEAKNLKAKWFAGNIGDDRVRYYYQNNGIPELDGLISQMERYLKMRKYLFYALIATNVRYSEISGGHV